jgi:hypothetical protein
MTCPHLSRRVSPITSLTLCEACGEAVPGANLIAAEPPTWVPNHILLRLRAEGSCDVCKQRYREGDSIKRLGRDGFAHAACLGAK